MCRVFRLSNYVFTLFFLETQRVWAQAPAGELTRLKDIHLPPAIGRWPLAFGWYLVIFMFTALLLYVLYRLYRRYQYSRPKRQALKLLREYDQRYQQTKDSREISARLSELLKRVALAYYPRSKIAGLYGDQWIQFLNRTGNDVDFTPVQHLLTELPYQAADNSSLKPLFSRAEAWIKQRGKL